MWSVPFTEMQRAKRNHLGTRSALRRLMPLRLLLFLIAIPTLQACGPTAAPAFDDAGAMSPDVAPPDMPPDAEPTPPPGSPRDGGVVPPATSDASTSPDAASADRPMPPPLPSYSRGACPTLTGGVDAATSVVRGFPTGDETRSFRLVVPATYDPDGSDEWPVLFAWHWLNSSSRSFVVDGELDTASEEMGFIAVLPDAPEDDGERRYVFDWPFAESWGAEQELVFFDDLLACVSSQFRVDRRRISGVGVSAGALWLTHLSTTRRAEHLASVVSLSGGLGDEFGLWRMEYAPQPHKFPALVLWGGPTDWLGLDFNQASMRYRDALLSDSHFVVQCVHDAGHAMPPVDVPADGGTRFRSIWRFLLDHPYGLLPTESPYNVSGLPAEMPSWCAIAR